MINQSDLLERQIAEIEALHSIYDTLAVNTRDIEEARSAVGTRECFDEVPLLTCSLTLTSGSCSWLVLINLPREYPLVDPSVAVVPDVHIDVMGLVARIGVEYAEMERLSVIFSEILPLMTAETSKQGAYLDTKMDPVEDVDGLVVPCGQCTSSSCLGVSTLSLLRQGAYSHHIISEWKRSTILMLASRLNLGGVMKAGWPGLIIAEGESSAVRSFFQEVSRWQWKRFVIRAEELIQVHSSSGVPLLTKGGKGKLGQFAHEPSPCFQSHDHVIAACNEMRAFRDGFLEVPPDASLSVVGDRCRTAGVHDMLDAVLRS